MQWEWQPSGGGRGRGDRNDGGGQKEAREGWKDGEREGWAEGPRIAGQCQLPLLVS